MLLITGIPLKRIVNYLLGKGWGLKISTLYPGVPFKRVPYFTVSTRFLFVVLALFFCPASRKYDTFNALPFRLLYVVSLPGGAKGRHAKIR